MPKRATSTSWKPGQSGNPSGKHRDYGKAREAARSYSQRALARMVELMDSSDPHVAIRAAEAVWDRSWGKPGTVDDTGSQVKDFTVRIEVPCASYPPNAPKEGGQ